MDHAKAPYGLSDRCACPSLSCNRANFLEGLECAACVPYARAYVVSQTYANCAPAEQAIRKGTYFEDLYMPYAPCLCKMKEVRR